MEGVLMELLQLAEGMGSHHARLGQPTDAICMI